MQPRRPPDVPPGRCQNPQLHLIRPGSSTNTPWFLVAARFPAHDAQQLPPGARRRGDVRVVCLCGVRARNPHLPGQTGAGPGAMLRRRADCRVASSGRLRGDDLAARVPAVGRAALLAGVGGHPPCLPDRPGTSPTPAGPRRLATAAKHRQGDLVRHRHHAGGTRGSCWC